MYLQESTRSPIRSSRKNASGEVLGAMKDPSASKEERVRGSETFANQLKRSSLAPSPHRRIAFNYSEEGHERFLSYHRQANNV